MLCAITECFDRLVYLRGLTEAYTAHICDSPSLLSDIYTRLISLCVEAVWCSHILGVPFHLKHLYCALIL